MRSAAHRRLIYDEFFFFQAGNGSEKSGRILEKGIAFNTAKPDEQFYALLPFSLTGAQKRVVGNFKRYGIKCSMNRLLQGDVGSGKTIVSMAAMIRACENNYQSGTHGTHRNTGQTAF